MTETPERYRKLPGTRRGFIRRSSVWMGSDHLLLVNSVRFREDYKRFYLRDVQAIVVAGARRFELSTRAAAIGLLWLVAYLASRNFVPHANFVFWAAGVALAVAWFYIHAASSCRCRIYTAVSRDDLPSVDRTWTARRFLEAVEPRIGQVQGVIDGSWAEAIETRQVGPATAERAAPSAIAGRAAAPGRTTASDVFVASLFAVVLLDALTLHAVTRALQWAAYGLAAVQIGGAIAIFAQYHRGLIRSGMQKLAVATLIAMGATFYVKQIMGAIATGGNQLVPDLSLLAAQPGYILVREIDAGVWLALGLVGAAISLASREEIG